MKGLKQGLKLEASRRCISCRQAVNYLTELSLPYIMVCKSKYKKVCVLPLDFTFRIGSAPTFLYFYFYLNTAYAGHYVYFIMVCTMTVGLCSIKNCSGLLSFLGGQTRYSLSTNLSNLCECNPLYNEVVVSAFFDMDVQSTA